MSRKKDLIAMPSPAGRKKARAALLSIISNTCLTALKLVIGFLTGSMAIISEAIHSGMDLLAALMTYLSVKVADRPPDHTHPFGHGKAENLAALFEGTLILIAGLLIIKQSVAAIIEPQPLPGLGLGVLVMLLSAVVNIFVSRYLFKVGKQTESAAVIADAWHLRTDVYTSLGVLAALSAIMLGRFFRPDLDLTILDPLCAITVALVIIKTGVRLSWEAINNLLDQSLNKEETELILNHIKEQAPRIIGYGDIKTRRSGSSRIVYMELKVDGAMSVEEAHKLGETMTESIREHFPDSQIIFHLEPQ